MMTAKPERWTEQAIYKRLESRYPSPAYVLLPQVRNGTGFTKRARTADAIAVSVWPSRGLYLTGFEIKVSRNDWRKELADPSKSVSIQKYCRYWYVVSPVDVVPIDEVPDAWGLIYVHKKKTTVQKQAPKLDEQPPDMPFVCSVLRSASEAMVTRDELRRHVDKATAHAAEAIEKAKHYDMMAYDLERLRERVCAFEEASGVSLKNNWSAGRIGEAVKVVQDVGLDGIAAATRSFKERVDGISQRLGHALAALEKSEVSDG